MAARGGGGGWRTLLDGLVTAFLIGIMLVILAISPAWDALTEAFGIGGHVDVNSLFESDKPTRRADAKSLTELLGGTGKTGSTGSTGKTGSTGSTGKTGSTVDTTYWQSGLNALDAVKVAKANPGGYDRAGKFGGWSATKCGRATTRDLILARDLKDVTQDKECRVTAGRLADPYTGRTITFKRGANTSGAVQIDHVVALQDAWASGARDWSQAKRVEYANSPDVLLASDGPANMAKGVGVDFNGTSRYASQKTGAPDVWMPDNKAYRCDYMAKRALIKKQWNLSMTAREKQQTVTFLASCVAGKE